MHPDSLLRDSRRGSLILSYPSSAFVEGRTPGGCTRACCLPERIPPGVGERTAFLGIGAFLGLAVVCSFALSALDGGHGNAVAYWLQSELALLAGSP